MHTCHNFNNTIKNLDLVTRNTEKIEVRISSLPQFNKKTRKFSYVSKLRSKHLNNP